ncbi:FtsX-like permease family protein [Embleya sp. NPDC050154]|uniref:FtsX-like permease family protein n=1 Tax=Embleya sp. NPDC050154 TaxID=3363988 RepID=UPI0037AEB4C4
MGCAGPRSQVFRTTSGSRRGSFQTQSGEPPLSGRKGSPSTARPFPAASVAGRRREFALHRLVGAGRRRVLRVVAAEAVVTWAAGVILGTRRRRLDLGAPEHQRPGRIAPGPGRPPYRLPWPVAPWH